MQERKFTDKEAYQRTAIIAIVMFIVFTILMDIIIGLVAAFVCILWGPYFFKKAKITKNQ